MRPSAPILRELRTVGLFAGVGGLERGLERHGHIVSLLAEIDPAAQAVLRKRFPGVSITEDVRVIKTLPPCDLVSAGFPCQNLSQCGKTEGIEGCQSSLVREVFRLVERAVKRPDWVLLENVPFMLQLDAGRAMTFMVTELTRLGYRWAYRTINVRAFGIPQRRRRVVLLASQSYDPQKVLFADDKPEIPEPDEAGGYGFYWTEGLTGLGWAPDCVPTLKGGSSFGIPSPPAIWIPRERRIVTISIRDAERLQGFPADWTAPAERVEGRVGARWRVVGNAVCVRLAAWIGRRLARPGESLVDRGDAISNAGPWPPAAYGDESGIWKVNASDWPVVWQSRPILQFLKYPTYPLSVRATAGFLSRAQKSRLRFAQGFLADVAHHLACVSQEEIPKLQRQRKNTTPLS